MQQAIAIVIGATLIAGALAYQGWSQHQDRQGGQRFQEFEADKLDVPAARHWSGRASVCLVRGKSKGEEREGVARCFAWSE
jgi:Flp pilus assembly protein TadB